MSWFDATGLASIAKSALKEAQKTIDKALDIKEDFNIEHSNIPLDTNSEDLYESLTFLPKQKSELENEKEPKLTKSVWGSFSGSFFDLKENFKVSPNINLEDTPDASEEHFSKSKLVVQSDTSKSIEEFEVEEEIHKTPEEYDKKVNEIEKQLDTAVEFSELLDKPASNIETLKIFPENDPYFANAITKAPGRNPLLIGTQPQGNNQDMMALLQKTNIIDIPLETEIERSVTSETSTDEGSQSDRTIVNDIAMMSGSECGSTTTETSSKSLYLKNMIADAMTEKKIEKEDSDKTYGVLERLSAVPSSVSSESRSDLVKIGSDHTSGDEETTTSSDIEIISSPNGDSSSTQSRQSPSKICKKEESIDENPQKIVLNLKQTPLRENSSLTQEDLLKKILEMADVIADRETKLINLNRRNAELEDLNNNLEKMHLDYVENQQKESTNLSQVTEEYTERLSSLEKKCQQTVRENDILKKQLEKNNRESLKISKGEFDLLIAERENIIKELREEGEKLSKQQLNFSNIIKKLRAKEKENEGTIKNLRETIENLLVESERLKKSLAAKDEVERSQIEAVHQLTKRNSKLESEISKLQSQNQDLKEKYEKNRKTLEESKIELTDRKKTNSEFLQKEQMLEDLENQRKITEMQNKEILNQLKDLRVKLQVTEEEFVKKEQKLRLDNKELLQRLEDAELRNEELSQSVLEVSKPLIRQLESLQAMHSLKMSNFEKIEEELTNKIRDLEAKLQISSKVERSSKEESFFVRSKFNEVEGQLNAANNKIHILQMEIEQFKTGKQLIKNDLDNKSIELCNTIKENQAVIEEQEQIINRLQQDLVLEKATNVHRTPIDQLSLTEKNEQHSSESESSGTVSQLHDSLGSGKISVDSIAASFWSQDEAFDIIQTPAMHANVFEMQLLQSNLKQREGEVQQLQWELNRREQERSLLNLEISTLLTKVENIEGTIIEFNSMKNQFEELQKQYDTLCQLYGEKVEENEELKLDLQDVKEMYKGQIDELLRQQKMTRE